MGRGKGWLAQCLRIFSAMTRYAVMIRAIEGALFRVKNTSYLAGGIAGSCQVKRPYENEIENQISMLSRLGS